MRIPERYVPYFKDVWVELGPTIATSVGPRGTVGRRWVCRRCGSSLKPNSAGAQSHIAKHLREAADEQERSE